MNVHRSSCKVGLLEFCQNLMELKFSRQILDKYFFNVFQIPTYCTIYLHDKTHVKIRTSNPLKFFKITLLHVSTLPDHHQGVNVPIYEVIEYFYIC